MESSAPETNPGNTDPALLSMSLPHKLPDGPRSPPDSTVNAPSSSEKLSSEKPPPHSNSVSSTVQTPATPTPDDPKTSGATVVEQEGDDEADSDSESDSEEPQFKRGRPGNPGMWKPEQVAYLKERLPAFNALGSNSRARTEFFVNLLPDFLVKFPRERYPPPEPSRVAKAFRPLSDEKVNAMKSEDRKAYKKREKRALRSDDDRFLDSLKGWYKGQQQRKNLKSSNPFKSHYKTFAAKKEAPKKPSLAQFVLKHEDYKDEVAERSEETGSHDRLASRVKAAQEILAELDDETVQGLEAEAEQHLKDRRENLTGAMDKTSDGKTLNMERELELALCRRNLTSFAQPFLDFVRQHTGMVCFFQAGYERDHPSEGHDFEIVSLSSVPEGAPKFPDHNMNFFGQFGREFAKWVRAIKLDQMERGVEYPLPAALEGTADEKTKDKGKKKAVPARASTSPTLLTPPPAPSTGQSAAPASTSATSASTRRKGKGSRSSGSSDKSKQSPSPDPADPPLQTLPPPPSTDGMSIYEKQAAYREWHAKLAEAMGLKEDVRNLFAGKQGKGTAHSLNDDDDYEGDEAEGGSEGPGEVFQRNLRPRKAAMNLNDSAVPDNSDPNSADIPEPNDDVPELNNTDISEPNDDVPEPNNTDISEPNDDVSEPNNTDISKPINKPDDSTLNVDPASETARTESLHNRSAPIAAENESPVQPITEGDESTAQAPQDATKPPPRISSSSSDAMSGPGSASTAPVGLVDPVVVDGHGDVVMNMNPALGTPNARLFDAIEVPIIDPYPPESLKNGTFVREYATLLLKAPEGEPLPAIWFPLVHNWIELEERWESIELEPEKLARDGRPQAFSSWFQAGRTKRPGGRVPPVSVQLPNFRDEWWSWYDALNPNWRPREGNVVLPGGDGEWDKLACSGKDGFALLLIGLRWWFDRGGLEDKVGLGHWEHAVKGLFDTTMRLHKWCDQTAANSSLAVQGNLAGATTSRRDRVRKSPDSRTDDGPDSHRAKRRV